MAPHLSSLNPGHRQAQVPGRPLESQCVTALASSWVLQPALCTEIVVG